MAQSPKCKVQKIEILLTLNACPPWRGFYHEHLSAAAEPSVELAEPGVERSKLRFPPAGMSIRNLQLFWEDRNRALKKNQVARY